MKTIEEFRMGGGVVAYVPNDSTHIQTRPKSQVVGRSPAGIDTVYFGPEILQTEVVMDDGKPVRVVRFSSLVDFDHISSRNLGWQQANTALYLRVCQQLRTNNSNRPGPIG
jgi:hypothetical protein